MGLTEEQKKQWQKEYQVEEKKRKIEDAKTTKYQRVGVIGFLSFIYAKADPNFAPSWIALIMWGVCSLCIFYLCLMFLVSMWKGE